MKCTQSSDKFQHNIYTQEINQVENNKLKTEENVEKVSEKKNNSNKKLAKQQSKIESILSNKQIILPELKKIVWNGLPFENPQIRSEVWKLLLGHIPLNTTIRDRTLKKKRQDYSDTCEIYNILLANPSKNMNDSEFKMYKQIAVDIPRTLPEHKLFSVPRIRSMMTRILYVWSMRHPASGYVQGFNDLCCPFIIVFLAEHLVNIDWNKLNIDEKTIENLGEEILFSIEADSYGCFASMMNKIQNNYTHNQPGLQRMVNKLEEIIKMVDPEVYDHFVSLDVKIMQFTFRWMNCYLMRELSVKLIIRIWDTYFSEEDAFNNFHLYVCACIILNFSEKIKGFDFQELFLFLQDLPTGNWEVEDIEVILAKAYQINMIYGNTIKENKNFEERN